jgi:hypothetical protein
VTRRYDLERLLAVLEDDRELLEEMERVGLIRREAGEYDPESCERARVVRTLVRELEVNWAGVEIIIRMREDLLTSRRQLAEALELLRERERGGSSG